VTENGSQLRLLQLAPRFAGSPTGGAELRNFHLADRLSRHMRVTHIGFGLPGNSQDFSPAEGLRFISVPRDLSYRPIELVRGILGPVPFSVLNYIRPEMTEALRNLLREERFDILQMESVHLAGYLPVIRSAENPPRILACDWHNIESEVLRRYGDNTSSLARRVYAYHAARKLAKFERRFVQECDLHVVVSARDRDALLEYGCTAPIVVIENGVDIDQFSGAGTSAAVSRRRILFVGAMDYHANIDGALFFAREAWPQIASKLPDAVFTIVGRSPSPEVLSLAKLERIEVTGTVSDVRPYYHEALIAVAPLRVGGGTRLKILEAMAAGIPVVSTALGAEGLAAKANSDYLLADTGPAMAQAILDLMGDPLRYAGIAEAGRELVQQRYDWARLGDSLAQHLLALKR
jgi:glycosyltransferase involved in cell wall biosynthesis